MMKYLCIGFVFLGCLLTAGCPVPYTPPTPGKIWYGNDTVTGRGMYLYIPMKYRKDTPMPILISCHGTPPWDVAEHHSRTWEWYAERYGFILLCPKLDGTDGIFGSGASGAMKSSERYILSMISMLSYRYNVDRNNIWITGFSGGGFPAYWVGLRNPDVFSCIVAQNANFNERNTDGWYPLASNASGLKMMIYYGEGDPAPIVLQSENAIRYLRSMGFHPYAKTIPGGHERHPEVAMAWLLQNKRTPIGTLMTPGTTPAGAGRNGSTYTGGSGLNDPIHLQGPRPEAP
ncbi:MAG: prolyl oligopeptidase family serine peptidase [Phycisphaerales bacterium]|nr:prolyl oligopeptidase family serine peptidase [Phycisphaerales bacterium]MBT7171501.1 prolyl oligopeptidase family serine peptidase [Phycisphaerales bacterium]